MLQKANLIISCTELSDHSTYLFLAAVSTDHTVGIGIGMILFLVMTHITGIGFSAAWEPAIHQYSSVQDKKYVMVLWVNLIF